MKKIFITLLLFPVGFLHSQDFDEAYLNSLPDSIRKDVIERMADRDESDENPTYRNRSSMVEKSEEENEEEDENVIERFGKSFFETVQSSFMPINEPNLNSSYVLDFGDELEVQIIGQINLTESLSIERDGSINIPDIGKVFISGLSISDASALIKNKVQNAYIGSESFITLKDIRDINVLIAGNAFSPGIYTLNGNSSMLHALSMAGGIDDIGSYRDISLVRDGEIIDSLDIYEVLIFGRHNLSKGLRSGDSIVVNPLLNIVSIESGVLRPGNYELKDDESVEEQRLKELISPLDMFKGAGTAMQGVSKFGKDVLQKKTMDLAKNKAIDYAKDKVAKATAATTLPVIGAAGAGALGGLLAVDAAKKLNPFKKKKKDKEEVTGEDIDKMSMGDTIKDFYKSDAPQFKGKSKKKRREMAIAAKLATNEGSLNDYNFLSEREELDESVVALVKTFGKGIANWISKKPALAGWLGVGGFTVWGLLPAATNWARENLGLIGLFAVGGVGLNEYLRRTGMSRQEAKKAQAEWELNHKKKLAKELAPIIGKDAAFPEIGQEKDKELARADKKVAQTDKKVQQFKAVTS